MLTTVSRQGKHMGLLDEVRAESHPPRRNKMDEIRESLNEQDYEDFVAALQDIAISQRSLIRALNKRGVHIGTGTISELRRDFLRGDV